MSTKRMRAVATLYARFALGAAFLSAVSSRFGLWKGAPGMQFFGDFISSTPAR